MIQGILALVIAITASEAIRESCQGCTLAQKWMVILAMLLVFILLVLYSRDAPKPK
jgi:hypothetical protein